jgi:hypothetical protein
VEAKNEKVCQHAFNSTEMLTLSSGVEGDLVISVTFCGKLGLSMKSTG